MEVRNQFAHNPNAVSFTSFEEINKDIYKYLLKYSPLTEPDEDIEKCLSAGFSELFTITAGKLLVIEVEYTAGIEKQLRQKVNDKIVENMDKIWANALEKSQMEPAYIYQIFQTSNDDTIEKFFNYFKMSMTEFSLAELKQIDPTNTEIYKHKKTIAERVAQIKQEGKETP